MKAGCCLVKTHTVVEGRGGLLFTQWLLTNLLTVQKEQRSSRDEVRPDQDSQTSESMAHGEQNLAQFSLISHFLPKAR